MSQLTSPLKNLKVASPCSANWDEMYSFADKRVRFCSQCNLNVYNLSAMQQGEAEALIMQTEGRLCVRFYQRADGSVLTQNCPVGLQALKARVSRRVQFVFGMILGLLAHIGLFSLKDSYFSHKQVMMGDVVPTPMVEDLKRLQDEKSDAVIIGRIFSPVSVNADAQRELPILKLPTGKTDATSK